MKMMDLEGELIRCYGASEGQRVYRTVTPGILADFLRMYAAAVPGSRVKEDYDLEDGKARITLAARKTGKPADIEAAFISEADKTPTSAGGSKKETCLRWESNLLPR